MISLIDKVPNDGDGKVNKGTKGNQEADVVEPEERISSFLEEGELFAAVAAAAAGIVARWIGDNRVGYRYGIIDGISRGIGSSLGGGIACIGHSAANRSIFCKICAIGARARAARAEGFSR